MLDLSVTLDGLPGFTFTGGWNSTYTSQAGVSIFNDDGAGGNMFTINNCQNITISGFVGDDVLGTVIDIDNSQNVNIQNLLTSNNTVPASTGVAIDIDDSSEVTISDVYVTDKIGKAGLDISRSTNVTIDNYTFINAGDHLGSAPLDFFQVLNAKVLNSVFTNNFKGFATNIISLYSSGVLLSNNRIGGIVGSNAVAIFEPIPSDVTNYQLIDNKFVTNSLGAVIRDFINGYSTNLTDLNNATWSGASQASGNTFVVF